MKSHGRVRRTALSCVAVLLSWGSVACAPRATVTPSAPASFDEKVSWILRLENQRMLRDVPPVSNGPVDAEGGAPVAVSVRQPDLVHLLSDPEPQLRRRAALAIGRVGQREGVAPLIEALTDQGVEVRQMAAFALGMLGDPAATAALEAALDDPAPLVQGRAAEALGRIGAAQSVEAIATVARRHVTAAFGLDPEDLGHPLPAEAEAFRLALYALGELQAYEPLASVVLQEDGQPILWWWPVAYALQRTNDPRALDALVTLSGVEGSIGVAFAAEGLGNLGQGDARAVDALVALLDRELREDRVVTTAVRALGRIDDPRAAAALRAFVLQRDVTPVLRLGAIEALGRQTSASAADLFVELMSARWAPLRGAAIRALARSDPAAFLIALSSLGPDPDWRVRAARAEGLAHVEPIAGEYQLTLMLRDEDARVIPSVLRSLASLGASDLSASLRRHLEHPDVVVRKTAAELLGRTAPQGDEVVPALVAAYAAAASDPSFLARAAIVDALATRTGGDADAALARALEDPAWPVRLRALEHLASRGSELVSSPFAGRPAPGRRSVDFTAPSLVRPTVSPHVYIETDHGTIELELLVIEAPIATDNLLVLARRGFYDGLTFHRVVPNHVVQTGDPRGDGAGGPGYTLRDELGQVPFLRGTVGLALDGRDTGGSQFFITPSPQPQLDGRYPVVARVVAGMEVVDQVAPGDEIRRVWVWDGTSLAAP